jgi:hypothetical protein
MGKENGSESRYDELEAWRYLAYGLLKQNNISIDDDSDDSLRKYISKLKNVRR